MLTQEELQAINRYAKAELTEDQVYTFSVRLCDNEVDRDMERFATEDLERLGELFLGKSGIFDHQWSAKGQTARIYRTEVVREPGVVTAAGDEYRWLKAWAYLMRPERHQKRGQRGVQHGPERVLRMRGRKRRLQPCEGAGIRR